MRLRERKFGVRSRPTPCFINDILGVWAQRRATVRWPPDQVTWDPEITVAGFGLEEISEYMERV